MVWRSSSQVPVLDVAPVFPQVDDDAVGPGQLRQGRGGHRVRLVMRRACRRVAI